MLVFSSGSKGAVVWGPTASVSVKVDALGGPSQNKSIGEWSKKSFDEASAGLVGNSWILSDIRIGASEVVDVRQCFNDVSYIYALGNDQSRCAISLSFLVFIGSSCGSGGSNMSSIREGLERYVENRISENTEPMNITVGSFSVKGWLVSIDVSGANPDRGFCHGTLNFIMQLSSIGSGSNSVNAPGKWSH